MELLTRRIIVITAIACLPLAILSLLDGRAFAAVRIPFFYDAEAYARFLVALPVLIAAELIVHRRVTPTIGRFIQRQIVTGDDIPRFNAAVGSA